MGAGTRRFEAAGDRVRADGAGATRLAAGFTVRGEELSAPVRIAIGDSEARTYRGSIAIRSRSSRLILTNWVLLEDYLRSVVPLELSADAPRAALQAQAVAARSYALAAGDRHADMPYNFCDSSHCQLYLGVRSEAPRTDAAVQATEAQVLTYGGKVIEATFHSCCGGATSAIADVWAGGKPVPYLVSCSDIGPDGAYCRGSPHFRWDFRVSAAELLRALRGSPSSDPGGRLLSVGVVERDAAGRAMVVEIVGERRVTMTGGELRSLLSRTLGDDSLRSTRFVVGQRGDMYVFEGTGHGHGVGMCHWGAMGRAEAGQSYEEILRHYYPGTTLGKLP
jgi:stage II sporulation protein D